MSSWEIVGDSKLAACWKPFVLSLLLTVAFCPALFAQESITYLLAGAYTDGQPGLGIQVYRFDTQSGKLTVVAAVDGLVNASFLTMNAQGDTLWACTETKLSSNGNIRGFAFSRDSGQLREFGGHATGGINPVSLAAHPRDPVIALANYGSGSIALVSSLIMPQAVPIQLLQLEGHSVHPERQLAPHPHAVVWAPGGNFLLVPDLGADRIRVFAYSSAEAQPLQAREELDFHTVAGAGPRHLVFHPNGKWLYFTEELSGMVTFLGYAAGQMRFMQRVFSYSQRLDLYSSADIHLSADGRFLYVSNRSEKENRIALFSIDPDTGMLQLIGHQKTGGIHPRQFVIDPTGNFVLVANQVSGSIVVFRRDQMTGKLRQIGPKMRMPGVASLVMHSSLD